MESKIFTHINTATQPHVDGPMAGTSVAIDANISVSNWPTTAHSLALENYVALEDATLIQRICNAGATLKGRTPMAELGLGLGKDSWVEALNKGLSQVVLKTDTTGEARMAAAIAGCFGFKPSYGLISRSGMIGLVPSMESCGILSNSLGTITLAAQAMAGLDEKDSTMDPSAMEQVMYEFNHPQEFQEIPITLGVIKEMAPADIQGVEQALDKFGRADLKIREVSIKDFLLAPTVHNVIGSVEASSSAGRFDSVRYGHRTSTVAKNWNDMYIKSRGESFGPLVKAYLFQGGYFQYHNYNAFLDACRTRARLIKTVEKAFETVDLILLPVSANPDPPAMTATVSDLYDTFSLTVLANLTGNPAIVIPGTPALQLMGKRFGDARLLALAARVSDIHTGEV
jgi:aspartyl-tRNA(Asn)/glutamyl-tRNA(Gln) amidotransferase subunit A